jgi:3-deoxy-D-manno-octulosonate 8-phosphate phosphatase (KDO 8-P phosphatase)
VVLFLRRKVRKIRAILLDVDGVLTDAGLFYDTAGAEGKAFSAQDGYGITRALRAGIIFGIVTGRSSPVIDRRAQELGIRYVWQGVPDKLALLPEILAILKLDASEVLFIGDDTPDRGIMRAVGFAACPHDATREARQIASYTARKNGGHGAVREIIDRVLTARKLLRKDGRLALDHAQVSPSAFEGDGQ